MIFNLINDYISGILAGLISSSIISPFMTLIDLSIIKSQIENIKLHKSTLITFKKFLNSKHSLCKFIKLNNIMFDVYSATYITYNLTKQTNNEFLTLALTTFVNSVSIIYKDIKFNKFINIKKSPLLKSKSLIPYFLFGLRDMITVYSCFNSNKFLIDNLSNNNYLLNKNKNLNEFIISLGTPAFAQIFSTPIHILAFDILNCKDAMLSQRLKSIKINYKNILTGRIIRVIPAFGIGSYLNSRLMEQITPIPNIKI